MSQASIGITSRKWPARLRRPAPSAYLLEIHGISLCAGTLAKLACMCVRFRDAPRWSYPLTTAELDAFAVRRLGPLRRSTSDEGLGPPETNTPVAVVKTAPGQEFVTSLFSRD